MDEYLFIALAKLRADRLKVERETQAQGVSDESGQPQERNLPRARQVNSGSPSSDSPGLQEVY